MKKPSYLVCYEKDVWFFFLHASLQNNVFVDEEKVLGVGRKRRTIDLKSWDFFPLLKGALFNCYLFTYIDLLAKLRVFYGNIFKFVLIHKLDFFSIKPLQQILWFVCYKTISNSFLPMVLWSTTGKRNADFSVRCPENCSFEIFNVLTKYSVFFKKCIFAERSYLHFLLVFLWEGN